MAQLGGRMLRWRRVLDGTVEKRRICSAGVREVAGRDSERDENEEN